MAATTADELVALMVCLWAAVRVGRLVGGKDNTMAYRLAVAKVVMMVDRTVN